ncbi:MAG: DUF1003 domain-containing protein [Caulobacterales bacterium]|jgi:uncharacterized membrane protein|nr:DUF1003 domain-containing protein [Caulobacterales bacterium]
MSKATLELLEKLRTTAHARREPNNPAPNTFAQRAADAVAAAVGSWRFVLIQSTLLIGWLLFNSLSGARIDPYPFILLNLLLSFQAAYTAPIIMMSQNRQSEIDRGRAIEDFEINRKAEIEIETLHHKMDLLREQEIAQLTAAVARLTAMLEAQQKA